MLGMKLGTASSADEKGAVAMARDRLSPTSRLFSTAKAFAQKVKAGSVVPQRYADGGGLYLNVSDSGARSWVFMFGFPGVVTNTGKRKTIEMGLGPFPDITLAEARDRADEMRRKLRDGVNPIAARKDEIANRTIEAAKAKTFKECADAYIEAKEAGWRNPKHAAQWGATFNETRRGSLVFPAITARINDLPVASVDEALVLEVLRPGWLSKTETMKRVRGRIEAVLGYATANKYRAGLNPARWKDNLEHSLARPSDVAPVEHHQALPYAELPAFMTKLRARAGASARAMEFTILTASRTGEAIGARWGEFDLVAKLWIVPAGRMKAKKEHRVPLSERALAIVETQARDGEYVFGGREKGRPLSNMAMLELLRDMVGKGSTVHGFRSAFRDWAAEQTAYPNEMCEIALAHAVSDKTEAAYRRGDMMEKRRRLMSDWAEFCQREPAETADNVVTLRA